MSENKETPAEAANPAGAYLSRNTILLQNLAETAERSSEDARHYKDLFRNQPQPFIRDVNGRFVSDWGPYAIEVALAHARRGFRVHPLHGGTKNPAMPAWPDRATTDPAVIRNWWRKGDEGECCNIGAETSEFLVIDVDVKRRPLAEVIADLESRYGPLPKTWTASTPSGGEQYWCKPLPGVRIGGSVGTTLEAGTEQGICPDVDIKSWHGNAVLPGSFTIAKIKGGKQVRSEGYYRWREGCSPDDIPIADAPPRYVAAAQKASRPVNDERVASESRITGDVAFNPATEALLRSWITHTLGKEVKDRDGWRKYGMALARLGDEWSDVRLELWEELSKKAEGYEEETGCADEWKQILKDASNTNREGGVSTFRSLAFAAEKHGWTWETSGIDPALIDEAKKCLADARGEPERMTPEECFESVTLDDDWREKAEGNGDAEAEDSGDEDSIDPGGLIRARMRRAGDFVRERVPETPLIHDLMMSARLYTICGATGSGKTALSINMALAIAFNQPGLIGRDVEPGRVLFLSNESEDDFRTRLLFSALEAGISLRTLDNGRLEIMTGFATSGDMLKAAKIMTSRAQAAGEAFNFVIADTLQSYFPGDDSNVNAAVLKFIRSFRLITKLSSGPTVLIPSHPVKGATTERLVPYGAGSALNEVDGNFTFVGSPDRTTSQLHWEGKIRGPDFDPIVYKIEMKTNPEVADINGKLLSLPLMRPGGAVDAAVSEGRVAAGKNAILMLLAKGKQPSAATIGAAVGISKATAGRYLKELKGEKLVRKPVEYELTPAGERAAKAAARAENKPSPWDDSCEPPSTPEEVFRH